MPGRRPGPTAAAEAGRGQALIVWRAPEAPLASPAGVARGRALKQIWRRLAWRHHPDRADRADRADQAQPAQPANPAQRLEPAGGDLMMHRINALYAAGELELLTALWGEALPDDLVLVAEEPADEETARLRAHILYVGGQTTQARADLAALRDTFAHQVWAQVDRGEALGKVCADHWQEHLQALTAKVEATAVDLGDSVHTLESATGSWLPHPTGLAQRTDGAAHLKMAVAAGAAGAGGRTAATADARAAGLGEQMAELACAHPHLGALLSLTYLAGRARSTLLGLERFADWEARYRALSQNAHQPDGQGLAEALVEGMHWVEWGLRPSAAQLEGALLPGLCFVPEGGQAAMHIAAQSPGLRRQIGEALEVLGEAGTCGGCHRRLFFVALWRLAGIDSLRALVCPACGHRQRSYRLACGEDVVAALGDLTLEHGLVHELTVEVPALRRRGLSPAADGAGGRGAHPRRSRPAAGGRHLWAARDRRRTAGSAAAAQLRGRRRPDPWHPACRPALPGLHPRGAGDQRWRLAGALAPSCRAAAAAAARVRGALTSLAPAC